MTKLDFNLINEYLISFLNPMDEEQSFFYHNVHKKIKYDRKRKLAYLVSTYRLNILYSNEICGNNIYIYEFDNKENYLRLLLLKYDKEELYNIILPMIDTSNNIIKKKIKKLK